MHIALVTRTLTRNQGNVALSRAWQAILERHFPDSEVTLFERIPPRLKRYTLAQFAAARDPVAAFDAAARTLRPGTPWLARAFTGDTIRLDRRSAARIPSRLREKLNLRSRLAHLGLYDADFSGRQALLSQCDLMVMNAAGEFLPRLTDTPLQYLLDLRAAQLLGLKTAFVNTSFEIIDPLVCKLAVHVLDKADLVAFRDHASEARYRQAGGRCTVHIVPDAAMLIDSIQLPKPPTGRVAISLSARLSDGKLVQEQWRNLALQLRDNGLEPVFISNEWQTDEPVFQPWLVRDGFAAEGKGLDVPAYIDMLAGFDAVISARLHTCVLAMLAGTPVIPVEIETSKISGFFEQLDLPDRPLSTDHGWIDVATRRAVNCACSKQRTALIQQSALTRAQADLAAQLTELLARFGPPTALPETATPAEILRAAA